MTQETWKPAPGYEQWLEVSDQGNVRTLDYLAPSAREGQPSQLRRGALLKPDLTTNTGYPRIALKRQGKTYRINVHRLVALAFVNGHFPDATVDHIDGVRTNNDARNLRWLSRSENTKAQNADGRGVGKGERHPSAKLTDEQTRQLFMWRGFGYSFEEIGKMYGVSGSLVHKIITGKRRAHATPAARSADSNTCA